MTQQPLSWRVGRAVGRVAGAGTRAWARRFLHGVGGPQPRKGSPTRFARARLDAEVLVYFADMPKSLYQLEQWLPVLEQLDRTHRVAVLVRKSPTFRALREVTSLPVLLIEPFAELEDLYRFNDFKVCLYVNNSSLNFHSLMFTDLLHVHVNHGESDKVCMTSNQAKAYDLVFVAGQAALDRYQGTLINTDPARFRTIGRPQLDVPVAPYPSSSRPTVVYAPTWEGGRGTMDYQSLATLGPTIVGRLLAAGRYRVIYRPHAKVGSRIPAVADADARIRRLIAMAGLQDPSVGHAIEDAVPFGSLAATADALVCDVSSVAIDFLATGKPILLTDVRGDLDALLTATPVARAATIVDAANVTTIDAVIERAFHEDPHRIAREALAAHYFGDVTPGVALTRFVDQMNAAIQTRDRMVADKRTRGEMAVYSRRSTLTTLPSTETSSDSIGA